MNNEEIILQRLDRLEASLAPISETFKSVMELKDDLTPLINRGFKVLIEELQDVETAFQIEDLFRLIKQGLRSIRNFSWSLERLESLIDLLKTLEPLLKSTVAQLIHHLDDMEQKGVFRKYGAMLSVRGKVAKQYSPEDFELMSDAFTSLLGLLRNVANPEVQALLQRMAEIPACLELETCKSVGPVGLVKAAYSEDVKQGLGVLIELTKGLGIPSQEAVTSVRGLKSKDIQNSLHDLSKESYGTGKMLESGKVGLDKALASRLRNAFEKDIAATDDPVIGMIQNTREAYRQASGKIDRIGRSVIGKLVNVEGKADVDAVTIAERLNTMRPSQVKALVKTLDIHNPSVTNQVRRYYLETAMEKAHKLPSGAISESRDFLEQAFLSSLPKGRTFDLVHGNTVSKQDVLDVANIVQRLQELKHAGTGTDGQLKGGSSSHPKMVMERVLLRLCGFATGEPTDAPRRPPATTGRGSARVVSNVRKITSGKRSGR